MRSCKNRSYDKKPHLVATRAISPATPWGVTPCKILICSEIVALICKEDARYGQKAYEFVRLGLDHTVKELRKREGSRAERCGM